MPEAELATALAARPDYIALGPIYPTILKAMLWAPQGLDRLREWKSRIGPLPLVSIGGFTVERIVGVFENGADSAAVVTDITRNPQSRTTDPGMDCRDPVISPRMLKGKFVPAPPGCVHKLRSVCRLLAHALYVTRKDRCSDVHIACAQGVENGAMIAVGRRLPLGSPAGKQETGAEGVQVIDRL